MAIVNAVYFSSAANKTTNTLDCWQHNDLACYATSNNLAVLNIKVSY